MKDYKTIQIIGYSGSGKSTLAIQLGKLFNLPVLHLDNVQFYGNWQERTRDEQDLIVKEFMSKSMNGWVIDGNYFRVAPERFEKCDLLIFLNFNRFKCYSACHRRYIINKGKHRESFPCEEKFDMEFRKWVFYKGRSKSRRQTMKEKFDNAKLDKIILKNRRQIELFLSTLN